MALKMFALWDAEKIRAAIVSLEEQLAAGAASVGDPNGGQASFLTPTQAIRILDQLYARYEEKTGQRLRSIDRATIINVSVRRAG